jgi:N4-gp56 family major capsid protein
MAVMTTATVSAAVMTKYKKRAQSFLRKRLYMNKLGTMEKIDKNAGQTLSTFRVNNLTAQTSSLTEGTAPSEVSISTTTYTATLLQYGAFVKISDLLEVTGRSSMMDVSSKQLGYNAALTLDALMYNVLVSNAPAHYANNSTSGTFDAACVMTAQELRRLAKKFQAKDVNPGEDDLYNIILHPDCLYDIQVDDKVGGMLDVMRRAVTDNESEAIWKGEMTRLAGFRILQSSQITTTTVGSVTAYQNIAVGPDAVLNVDVESMPFNLFVNPSSNVSLANPLGQVGSVGWKATYVAQWISETANPRGYLVYSTASEPT